MYVQKVCMQSSYFFSYQKRLKSFWIFWQKKRVSIQGTLQTVSISIFLQLLTSHSSTSAQVSPSTPSVLQTAYAKGSTVSSVITEPILPRPLTPTVFPLLHYNNKKHVNVRKKINAVKILIRYLHYFCSMHQSKNL